jgi:hypothetical protein
MATGIESLKSNVARLVAPLDSPEMAEFVAQLAPVNALADRSPGFVWRLQTEAGDSTAIRAFDDPLILVNMSVWESRAPRSVAFASSEDRCSRSNQARTGS